tara:strand:+ start:242 stop:619 length:378 start_codon:yes stop_codon:yes gene_type:complete
MDVNDIMNKAIVIEHDVSFKKAAQIMSRRNIGCLIVLKGNKIIGIVTESDIVDNISCLDKKVSSIKCKKIITIDGNEDIDSAALIMTKKKIKRLPVLEKEKLIGIITATDIVANSDLLNEDLLLE